MCTSSDVPTSKKKCNYFMHYVCACIVYNVNIVCVFMYVMYVVMCNVCSNVYFHMCTCVCVLAYVYLRMCTCVCVLVLVWVLPQAGSNPVLVQ